jgi:glycine oxidase
VTTLVVGAGVIGLLSAWMLAEQGQSVVILDQGEAGRESSWAGGGIVSPLYPWRYSAAVTALAHWSQGFYPGLAQQLLVQTGIDPQVHVTGLYWLDLEDQAEALAWAGRQGRLLNTVAMDEVHRAVAPLGSGFTSALHMPGVANVRNPLLVQALRAALLRKPEVTVREHCPATGFVLDGARVIGVTSKQGEIYADRVVLAAGAWSGQLMANLSLALPVEPVKGQMILYRCEADFLPAMVLAKGRYAIPRRDGHVLIGSTLEHVGFDKAPTAEALASLKASAADLLPALAKAEVVKQWSGLRPGSPDGIPFIGEVPGHPGLWLNCGHYRNGLVLAPASCRLLVDLMQEREPIVDPLPYAPQSRLTAA